MIRLLKRVARKAIDLRKKFRANKLHRSYERNSGYCVICEQETVFVIYHSWLRDNYKCERCNTIPRNRALINSVNIFSPDWKNLQVHESSPGGKVSEFLKKNCKDYCSSHYYTDVERGKYKGEHRSEDLCQLTFEDNSFDLFLTSDVFEHVMEPEKAFSEIARVLKPGGMHIFTMPWYPKLKKTVQRASLNEDGTINYLEEAVYHGNPIAGEGSLVTFDWSLDFTDFIFLHSGMTTTIFVDRDRKKGIDGEFIEVFISRKPDGK